MNSVNSLTNNLSNNLKKLKKLETYEMIFIGLLILYLVSNVSTPYDLAPYVNNVYMYFSLLAIFILLFLNSNPLIALLFGIVAMVFLGRSKKVDHKVMSPSVANKSLKMENLNSNLKVRSLEEEVVGQIERHPDNIANPGTYNPVTCETHNASNV